MTKEEFIAGYCKRSKVTWEYLKMTQVVLPCSCGEPDCYGWAMVTNVPDLVRDHKKLNGE